MLKLLVNLLRQRFSKPQPTPDKPILDYQKLWMDEMQENVELLRCRNEIYEDYRKAQEKADKNLKLAIHYRNAYYSLLDKKF